MYVKKYFQGEEIGMSNTNITWEETTDPQACNTNDPINYWKSSRDPARTPFQWDSTAFAGISIYYIHFDVSMFYQNVGKTECSILEHWEQK